MLPNATSAAIAVGQRGIVRARSFPGREFSGKIDVIYPQINKETRTARVRVELANPDLLLLHDMYVDAEIDTGSRMPSSPFPKARCWTPAAGRPCSSTRGKGGSSRVKSSSAIAAGDMSRSARASPTASRWSSRPTS